MAESSYVGLVNKWFYRNKHEIGTNLLSTRYRVTRIILRSVDLNAMCSIVIIIIIVVSICKQL